MNEDQGPRKPPTIDLDAIYRKMDDDWNDLWLEVLAEVAAARDVEAPKRLPLPSDSPEGHRGSVE